MVHPYEDSDSSEDEVDWQDTRHDPYRAGNVSTERRVLVNAVFLAHHVFIRVSDPPEKPQAAPRRGFTGKGKNITTKHDEETCGRKNTARMENVRLFPQSPNIRFEV